MIHDVSAPLGHVGLVRATDDHRPAVERLQHAAYKRNREILGQEPLPLLANYADIFRDYEVWILAGCGGIDTVDAALILDTSRVDHVLVWSISRAPESKKRGLGKALLACAEDRARQLGHRSVRLYTGQPLTDLIDWYASNGYEVEHTQQLSDRTIVHMLKTLA